MRALVTGFNARTASPRRGVLDVTFAVLLSAALTDLGWDVVHGDQPIKDPVDEYDKVFIGIASPIGLSSNRAYTALAAIGHSWIQDKAVFFVDDPDVRKIHYGLDSVHRNPDTLFKPFFKSRLEYACAVEPGWQAYLLSVVAALRTREWPLLLVPGYPWSRPEDLTARLPSHATTLATSIDLSSYISKTDAVPVRTRECYWVTEEPFNSAWLARQRVSVPVKQLVKMRDAKRLVEYSSAWGVLADDPSHYGVGWVDPRLHLALQAGALWSGEWKSWAAVGDCFNKLPHVLEALTAAQHDKLVDAQRQTVATRTYNRIQAKASLHLILTGGHLD